MFKDYAAKALTAKVMAEVTISDGDKAYQIINFDVDQDGFLTSNFKLMPLIPDIWNTDAQPTAFSGVLGFAQAMFDGGERPEILFLTETGVFRYAPWLRDTGSAGNRGIEELYTYVNGSTASVKPQGRTRFPAQSIQVGNRIYFNFGDGGSTWVWDGFRLRPFGYSQGPDTPSVLGPGSSNGVGFSHQGRIGTLTSNMLFKGRDGDDDIGSSTHGINDGHWTYYVVFENGDGAYSPMSPASSPVKIYSKSAGSAGDAEVYRRKFLVKDIGIGPTGTVARILVRTPDTLAATIAGGDHRPRFLERIPNNVATELTDNSPDGELGNPWEDRALVPSGFYFMKFFSGSMFMMRTNAYPYRVWWSEQSSLFGSTPESIFKNHFMDISPSTGAITGSVTVTTGSADSASPTLLVYKEKAVHYVSGKYPQWQSGSLHEEAGMSGPNLVQTARDGSVIWYGNNTFWAFIPGKGAVIDVGGPIRKRLSRVNNKKAKKGISWVGSGSGELVFVLPVNDSGDPNMQFIWDSRFNGWRLKDDLVVKAAISLMDSDIVLVSGDYTAPGQKALGEGVYAYGNSYPLYATVHPTATYVSGWSSMGEKGPGMHALSNVNDLIVTLKEAGNTEISVSSYQDWNGDDSIESGTISASHPEDENIPYYGSVFYDAGIYRDARTYAERIPLSVSSASVFQVKLESSNPLSVMSLDVYGPMVALPGGRTPQ